MSKNSLYNQIKLKDIPPDIEIYFVTNEIIKNRLEHVDSFIEKYPSKFNNKKSFLRTRILIEYLDLRKNKNLSISHTQNISVISVSNKYKVGIDVERSSKKLTEKMSKKILQKNNNLNLSPIQIWTLMESTYKCLNCMGEHFLKYSFIKKNKKFSLLRSDMNIISVTNNFNEYTLGIAFNLEH